MKEINQGKFEETKKGKKKETHLKRMNQKR
jgi:hypothetical protein